MNSDFFPSRPDLLTVVAHKTAQEDKEQQGNNNHRSKAKQTKVVSVVSTKSKAFWILQGRSVWYVIVLLHLLIFLVIDVFDSSSGSNSFFIDGWACFLGSDCHFAMEFGFTQGLIDVPKTENRSLDAHQWPNSFPHGLSESKVRIGRSGALQPDRGRKVGTPDAGVGYISSGGTDSHGLVCGVIRLKVSNVDCLASSARYIIGISRVIFTACACIGYPVAGSLAGAVPAKHLTGGTCRCKGWRTITVVGHAQQRTWDVILWLQGTFIPMQVIIVDLKYIYTRVRSHSCYCFTMFGRNVSVLSRTCLEHRKSRCALVSDQEYSCSEYAKDQCSRSHR